MVINTNELRDGTVRLASGIEKVLKNIGILNNPESSSQDIFLARANLYKGFIDIAFGVDKIQETLKGLSYSNPEASFIGNKLSLINFGAQMPKLADAINSGDTSRILSESLGMASATCSVISIIPGPVGNYARLTGLAFALLKDGYDNREKIENLLNDAAAALKEIEGIESFDTSFFDAISNIEFKDTNIKTEWEEYLSQINVVNNTLQITGNLIGPSISISNDIGKCTPADAAIFNLLNGLTITNSATTSLSSSINTVSVLTTNTPLNNATGANDFNTIVNAGSTSSSTVNQSGSGTPDIPNGGAGMTPTAPPSRNSSHYAISAGANSHQMTLAAGGFMSDAWAAQRNNPDGFANPNEFYAAVLACNPNITSINNIPPNITLQVPQRMADGTLVLHYANGATISTNPANGDYNMNLPDGKGGKLILRRVADDNTLGGEAYTVYETRVNATGDVTFQSTGRQASLDAPVSNVQVQVNTLHNPTQKGLHLKNAAPISDLTHSPSNEKPNAERLMINGVSYMVGAEGELTRELGHGLTEGRNPNTGDGLIVRFNDTDTPEVVAKLAPGDWVQTGLEGGRICIITDTNVQGIRINSASQAASILLTMPASTQQDEAVHTTVRMS